MNITEFLIKICKGALFAFFTLLFTFEIEAQPIPLEIFMSEGAFLTSSISVSRGFSKDSKFKILSISSFEAYKENRKNNSSVMITDVTYSISKGINTGIGFTYNSVSGLTPTIGIGYGRHGRKHNLTIAPAVVFSENDASFRIIFNHSHKFRLNDKFNLYLSSKNLLTYRFNSEHIRSYMKQRAGLDYNTFQFGFGVNFDWFGVNKQSSRNIGLFLRKEF